jgi:hypothetical protein
MSGCLAGLLAVMFIAPATTPAACPGFVRLDQELDQKLLEVVPGMALTDFQARTLPVDT